jgi:hypothetical protein
LSFGNQLKTEFVLFHIQVIHVADKIILAKTCSSHIHLDMEEEEYNEKDEVFNSFPHALKRAIELKNFLQSKIIVVKTQDYPKYLPCLVVIE